MRILLILIFFLCSLITFLPLKTRPKCYFYWLFGILLFLLAAFRDGNCVRDYANYVTMYNDINFPAEPSFAIIRKLVHLVFNNVLFLFIIYAALGVFLKLKGFKELSSFYYFSILLYIGSFYIQHELTQMRVGVATGVFLLCVRPIYERDWKKFILFSLCAIFFHASAIIILPLWFLQKEKINIPVFASLIPISYLIYFCNVNIIDSFLPITSSTGYIQKKIIANFMLKESVGDVNVFNALHLARILIYYVLLWKSKITFTNNKYAYLLLQIQGISLASFVLFASVPIFAFRISEFFGVVELITIPMLIYVLKPKWIAKPIVAIIALAMLLINIFYLGLIK